MNPQQKALLLTPLAVAAATGLYFGFRAYVDQRVKHTADTTLAAIAPVVEVEYDRIESTLAGRVKLAGVRIHPRAIDETLRADAIAVDTPGLKFIMGSQRGGAATQALPQALAITVQGLQIDTGGELMRTLDRLAAATATPADLPATTPATMPTACGGQLSAGLGELGYQHLTADLYAGYWRDDEHKDRNQINLHLVIRDAGAIVLRARFNQLPTAIGDIAGALPRLQEAELVYRDLSYARRVAAWCAGRDNTTTEDYAAARANLPDAEFAANLGLVPGPGLRAALRTFLAEPDEARLHIEPDKDLKWVELPFYKPKDVLASLNLSLKVNGVAVTDLSYLREPRTQPEAESELAKAVPRAPAAPEPVGYQAVPIGELPRHIGRELRVTTINGKVYEGVLTEFQGNALQVEARQRAGTVSVRVELKRIKLAEIR